jgi:lipopolysaccharide/colanic/teichoic acid biosynthesis glycosyltransferase
MLMQTTCNQSSDNTSSKDLSRHLPVWKRGIDLICCLVALPFLAGLTVIMTIVTKLVAPGPVFFRQERIGCEGRRFWIYKFRTMRVGSDTNGHQVYFKELIGTNAPMMKLDSRGDSRLILGCRLLRASGLDELPQIINVLRREMSIVGPRPCIGGEYEAYQSWQRQRCDAMPGLTGLWQVSGKNRTTFEEMVNLDIRYGKTKSFWMDVKIITLTVPALLVQIYDTRVRKMSNPVTARAFSSVSLRSTQSASPIN